MNFRLGFVTLLLLLLTAIVVRAQDEVDTIYPVSINEVTNDTIKQDVLLILNGKEDDCLRAYKMGRYKKSVSGKTPSRDLYVRFNKKPKRVDRYKMCVYSTPEDTALLQELNLIYHGKMNINIDEDDLAIIKEKYLSSLRKSDDYSVVVSAYRKKCIPKSRDYVQVTYVQDNLNIMLVFVIKFPNDELISELEYTIVSEGVSN